MLRKLEIFKEVAFDSSISNAAKRLHMSQPAVSVAIKELEEQYQCLLFHRVGKRLVITDKGSWLFQRTVELFDRMDMMEQRLKEEPEFQKLRVGVSMSVGNTIFPSLVKEVVSRVPTLDIYAQIESSQNIEDKLIKNVVDIGILEGVSQDPRLISHVAFTDRFVLVVPIDYDHEEISLKQLSSFKFLAREKGSGTRELVDAVLSANGVRLHVQWESHSVEAIIQGIIHHLGVCILPYALVKNQIELNQVKTCRIRGLSIERVVTLAYHRDKDMQDIVSVFLKSLKSHENFT